MLGSIALEIGIGLVFTYLILSLIVTSINEGIASLLRSRAKHLVHGIRNMLEGKIADKGPVTFLDGWSKTVPPVPDGAVPETKQTDSPNFEGFFSHPLIRSLMQSDKPPSYIPSHLFASTVLSFMNLGKLGTGDVPVFKEIEQSIGNIKSDEIKKIFSALLVQAKSDLTDGVSALKKFTDQVERWYDDAMDRIGGWYKRRTQAMLFIISAVLVTVLNADTLEIAHTLATEEQTLRAVTALAEKSVGANTELDPAKLPSIAQLASAGIPLNAQPVWNMPDAKYAEPKFLIPKVAGLLLTAFAISLGAPFWFDVLKKFMSVRGVGRAPEEEPPSPKKVPAAQ